MFWLSRRSFSSMALTFCLGWTSVFTLRAAEEPPLEYQVKAAFLMNFTKFVDWPPAVFEDEKSPLSVCIFGDDVFGGALDQIVSGEAAHGRRLAVQRLPHGPVPKSCQVLFISGVEKNASSILADVGRDVLTVGEGDHFLHDGGMIAFVIENRRVRFDISQRATGNAGLRISSKLLQVARNVEK
ncbi:MAG: YfiR family protein [Bryobacteraceae bacterium]|jgi:uncharacterized protein DUF4154